MADLVAANQNAVDPQQQIASFRAALQRIGFNEEAQVALSLHGFNSMYNLLIFSKEQIKRICKVLRDEPNPLPISVEHEQLLTAMWHWIKTRTRLNQDIDSELFDREVAISEAIKKVNIEEESKVTDAELKMPEKFKLTSKWTYFAEAVDTYLNRLKGHGRIPLNYVIQNVEVPEEGTVYATGQELVIARTPLEGDHFDLDNERVYGIVKQLILDGPAWAYITQRIDRSKDGRAAWKALQAHYKGESYMNKQKEEAYQIIENIHYKGERATFTFEHFTGQLTKAYNDPQRYGEPIIESKKVQDLLNKITDPRLEGAKQVIRINQEYENNFTMAINFLSESVDTSGKGKPRMRSNVSQGGRNNGRGYAPSNRGQGQSGHSRSPIGGRFQHRGNNDYYLGGRGRGGRGARGNRGRGCQAHYGRDGGDSSVNTYVPLAEWNAMTQQQRQAFLQARAATRISALASLIASTTTNGADDVSAITHNSNIPAQISQVSQSGSQTNIPTAVTNSNAVSVSALSAALLTPFGGHAAHGRSG
jgi:hypothetical protein